MNTISASRALTTEMNMDSKALKSRDQRLGESHMALVTDHLPKLVRQAITSRLEIMLKEKRFSNASSLTENM
jgi:hypothetical protein